MKITENKHSRLRQYIRAPKRFLRRARDFYVDSMLNFDGKVATANVMACPATHITNLPKEFGGCKWTKLEDNEYLEELYRSISRKYDWSRVEYDKPTGLNVRGRKINTCYAMDRSYSIALGKIGTIDEDEPCDFQEEVILRSEILPRSRSHAVTRRDVIYY